MCEGWCGSWSDEHQNIRDATTSDLDNGDYVTLARFGRGDYAYELLLTFSDTAIERLTYGDAFVERRMFKYAGDATPYSGTEDSEEGVEE